MTYNNENIFAKIIRKEIPVTIVFEDETTLAFVDQFPAAPTHLLIVPKGEYLSFHDFVEKASKEEVGAFFTTVQQIAEKLDIAESGYRVITNNGPDASQSVPHFHVHLLAGKPLGGLLPGDKIAR